MKEKGSGGMHDAWFFIGVFVFIFLIWIATGGPTHPIAFTGPTLAQPDVLGGGTYLALPRAAFGIGNTDVRLPGSSDGRSLSGSGGSGSNIPSPSTLRGSAFGVPSPYRGIVTLSHYVSSADADSPKYERIQLSIAQNAGLPINLTGWKFVSEATGNTAFIPKGTETPVSGAVNVMQDIVLYPGERAYVISGRSPIGTSFRENKCIGYLGSFQKYVPTLPQNCPKPIDDYIRLSGSSLDDEDCLDETAKISRCETVIDAPESAPRSCRQFMEKYFNYNGCVAAHKDDPDFEGRVWRIYLGMYGSIWRDKYEVIKLIDASGRTVDAFSY